MSISAARPRGNKDVAHYYRTTVALGDIVSIEEAKASRVGEWDAQSALAWLERNQDTVLNTHAQYRNYPSNNAETIKSLQHSQGKTVQEPSDHGYPPESQPIEEGISRNSRSPHISNRRSPPGSSQSHHISSSSLLHASPTKCQFSKEKITDPLNFPSSPATNMSPGNTDEELLSPYEREERRKRSRKSKAIREDGNKELEQSSPSPSQLSQLSWLSPPSPTMATPRKSGAELSRGDRPVPELSPSGNATISNARDKWKRPRESLNSKGQSRIVVWDEDEDSDEEPMVKNGLKRKIILSSSEPSPQVIEIQDSSGDEENFAQTSSSLTTKRSTKGDAERTIMAQQDTMLRTREATRPIKTPSSSSGLNGISADRRTCTDGDKREENGRGKGGNALGGEEKTMVEEKEETGIGEEEDEEEDEEEEQEEEEEEEEKIEEDEEEEEEIEEEEEKIEEEEEEEEIEE